MSGLSADYKPEQPSLVTCSWKHLGGDVRKIINLKPAWATCETPPPHTHTYLKDPERLNTSAQATQEKSELGPWKVCLLAWPGVTLYTEPLVLWTKGALPLPLLPFPSP